jgi:hypothetical protein
MDGDRNEYSPLESLIAKPREEPMDSEKARINTVNNYVMAGMLESLGSALLEVQKEMQLMKTAKEEKGLKNKPQLVSLELFRKKPLSSHKGLATMAIPEEDPGHWYGLAWSVSFMGRSRPLCGGSVWSFGEGVL